MGRASPPGWGGFPADARHRSRLPTGAGCFQDGNICSVMLPPPVLWLRLHSCCHLRSSFAQSLYLPPPTPPSVLHSFVTLSFPLPPPPQTR